MKAAVIYVIKNIVNQKFYVGSTTNTRERFRTHRGRLRRGTHHCAHLQAAWNKYGEECFKFDIVERLPESAGPTDLELAEDAWLSVHVGKDHCYNHGLASKAPWRGCKPEDHPNYGRPMSAAAKQKLREARLRQPDPRTGCIHSAETREKISAKVQTALAEGRGGRFIPSAETRAKMSAALKGNQCAKGYKRTAAEREAIRARMLSNTNFLGRTHTEETKTKMRKRVAEVTGNHEFPSLTAAIQHYGMKMVALRRALVSAQPISKGRFAGLQFKYLDGTVDTQKS